MALKQLAPDHHIVKCLKIIFGEYLQMIEIFSNSVMMSSCVKCKRKYVHVVVVVIVVVVVDCDSGNIVVVKEEGV